MISKVIPGNILATFLERNLPLPTCLPALVLTLQDCCW